MWFYPELQLIIFIFNLTW